MNLKNRRFRRNPATTATPHRRSEQAPQPPHAAPAPSPTEVYAGGYRYQFDWATYFRCKAADKRAQANDLNTRIQDAIGWASRYSAEADEMERMAGLVELDQGSALLADELPAPDGLATATERLFNGLQPGFPSGDDRPPMVSTDPDTPHPWRVTNTTTQGASRGPHEQDMTDAQIERIAEDAGENATVTYARETPWQEGRRHVARLDVAWADGSGSTVFERIDEQPSQDAADAETLTMHAVGGAW